MYILHYCLGKTSSATQIHATNTWYKSFCLLVREVSPLDFCQIWGTSQFTSNYSGSLFISREIIRRKLIYLASRKFLLKYMLSTSAASFWGPVKALKICHRSFYSVEGQFHPNTPRVTFVFTCSTWQMFSACRGTTLHKCWFLNANKVGTYLNCKISFLSSTLDSCLKYYSFKQVPMKPKHSSSKLLHKIL